MPLSIRISDVALRELARFPKQVSRKILAKIQRLSVNPEAGDIKPLHGGLKGYKRLRAGAYRIWFYVEGESLNIVRVTDRQEGYD